MIELDVQGLDKALRSLDAMVSPEVDSQIETGFLNIARALQAQIKQNIPKGPPKPGGRAEWRRLQRSIVAKKYAQKVPHNPTVFCGVDFKKGPHFHLYEFGFYHWGNGKFIPGKHPFAMTVHANEEKIVTEMERVSWQVVELAWDRG